MLKKFIMRSWFICNALVGILICMGPANAGGDYRRSYRPPPPPFTWSGAYAGLQVGYEWDNDSDIPWGPTLQSNDGPLKYDAVTGGVHLGYNIQRGTIVFGIEGDFELVNGSGDDQDRSGTTNGIDTEWMLSLRARLGYAMGKDLLYITGGYSYLEAEGVVRDLATQPDISTAFDGWTVGAGWERALDRRTSIRLEYRYTDYDLEVENYSVSGYQLGFEPEIHAIKIGVSAKF